MKKVRIIFVLFILIFLIGILGFIRNISNSLSDTSAQIEEQNQHTSISKQNDNS